MDIGRREFLHSAAAMLALGASPVLAMSVEAKTKPIGWAKWSAEEPWFPVYGWCPPNDGAICLQRLQRQPPYAVVACYADQAA